MVEVETNQLTNISVFLGKVGIPREFCLTNFTNPSHASQRNLHQSAALHGTL
jgi:hypothetical protein